MIKVNDRHDKLIIMGAGGHAKVCIDVAESMNIWKEIYLLDDEMQGTVLGKKIIGRIIDFKNLNEYDYFVGIGDNDTRKNFMNKLENYNKNIVNLIHEFCIISEYTICSGHGNLIMASVVINANVEISKGNIFNTSSVIEHDVIVGNYNHIGPGTILLGGVILRNNVFVGSNSTVHPRTKIEDNVVIGASSYVKDNISLSGVYVGTPAKALKR